MIHRFLRRPRRSLQRPFSNVVTTTTSATATTTTRSMATTSETTEPENKKIPLRWLDLRGTGISMLERLSLEEALLRHTVDNWMIVGTHEPFPHKYLKHVNYPSYITMGGEGGDGGEQQSSSSPNPDCLIVMGIGGKPDQLLNVDKVKDDKVLVCKRFSGGGTVVLDSSSLWTTAIGRSTSFSHVSPFPRELMEWSVQEVFGPTFQQISSQMKTSTMTNRSTTTTTSSKVPMTQGQRKTLVLDTKSCSATENRGQVIGLGPTVVEMPQFALKENDYILGDLKVGGNAQSIIKDGWLHHTSFLWDYHTENMEYLTLPQKRPNYRGDRPHEEFLVKLRPYMSSKNIFFSSMFKTCEEQFQLEKASLSDAISVIDEKLGGMDAWWDTNRTRIVHDL